MSQMCPNCSFDNPDNAENCANCPAPLRGLLGENSVLSDRYQLVSVLGCGAMGAVYLAHDRRLVGRRCAIKENRVDASGGSGLQTSSRDQFMAEASVLARLDHASLPKVSDYFIENDREYLVMDYVEGEDLDSRLQRTKSPLDEAVVLGWADQVLDALEYLHSQRPQPIIHRDIKPANLRVNLRGRVKLVDFGLVKLLDPNNPATKVELRGLGTPAYAPLEQFTGSQEHTDARSDIYSLGATMYHLLTNMPPPEVHRRVLKPELLNPPRSLNPALSARVERIVLKALAIHPDQRYQSAEEMRRILAEPEPAAAATPPPRRTAARRNIAWLGVAAAAAAAIIVGGIYFFVFGGAAQGDDPAPPAVVEAPPAVTPTEPPPQSLADAPTVAPTATATPATAPTLAAAASPAAPTVTASASATPPATASPSATPTATASPSTAPTATARAAPAGGSTGQRIPAASLTGTIAYPVFNGTDYNLYLGQVDGSGTRFFRANASQPAFSPDGARIAFHSWLNPWGLVNTDRSGNDLKFLADFVEDQLPTWSANGREIIYLSRREGDRKSRLVKVGSTQENSRGMVLGEGEYPTVGASGQLVFKGWGDTGAGLRTATINFENLQAVTTFEEDTAPTLSPDGQRMAFMSRRDGNWEIYLVNLDGSNLQRLTNEPAEDGLPVWSPDGQALAFASSRGGKWAVWAMTPTGADQQQLFAMEGSPDGFVGANINASRGWTEERLSWTR